MGVKMSIKTEVNGAVGFASLNRPEALNALNTDLLNELADALETWDRGSDVRCIIITGSERAFAAGADIKEMQPKTYSQMYRENLFGDQFDRIARIKKPIFVAVLAFFGLFVFFLGVLLGLGGFLC